MLALEPGANLIVGIDGALAGHAAVQLIVWR